MNLAKITREEKGKHMKSGKTLQELALEVERQNQAKKDYLVDTRVLTVEQEPEQELMLHMNLGEGAGGLNTFHKMEMNDIMHRQIGTHLGIPVKYYDKMKEEYPELLSSNVNGWFSRKPSRRMVRTLDGRARAFLSDRYRRIDNYEIAQTVLPILGEITDVSVGSFELTDAKMYLKSVNPRLTEEVVPGDVVQAGIMVTNSETGQGAVRVQPLIYRLVCKNGMVVNDLSQSRYHVGRTNKDGENFEIFRDETMMADDKAFLMKVEDTVRAAIDEVKFKRIVDRLKETKDAKMDTLNIPKVVELSAKEFNMTQSEGSGVLQHLITGGDLSLYGLANAVTRYSQDVASYDRATELEAVGWNMATMPPAQWRKLNTVEA